MTAKKEEKEQFETILNSLDERPLEQWNKNVVNGYVKRVADDEIVGKVIELNGNPEDVNITCPAKPDKSLGLSKRWICMTFKPTKYGMPFKFQVQCLDSSGVQRVFRFDTKMSGPKVRHFFADIPFGYKNGWNSVEVDLKGLMRRCYCKDLSQITRVKVHGSCRLRRIYFTDAYYTDENLPDSYRLLPQLKYSTVPPKSTNEPQTIQVQTKA